MAAGLHISISAEKVLSIGGLELNNSMLTSLVVSGLLILFAVWVRSSLKKTDRPTGVQNVAEWIVESLYSLVHGVTNNATKTEKFLPFIATFFLFILANNWFGLLPGVGTIGFYEGESAAEARLLPSNVEAKVADLTVHASTPAPHETETSTATEKGESSNELPAETASEVEHAEETEHKVFVPYFRAGTADLNMTLALGLISVTLTQIFGLQAQSFGYLKKYFNFSSPIATFVGLLELLSEFSKIVSFAFRLFGNVFAGEVLLAVIASIVAVVAPMPFYGLELFVGFIQALVFSMLSVVLFNMATSGHDEH